MPVMDGFQLLSNLKSSDAYCSIPVIMLTARAELQDKLKALRIGVDAYLIKPFEEEELFARIENLLNNALMRRDVTGNQALERGDLAVYMAHPDSIETEGSLVEAFVETATISANDMVWLADLETHVQQNLKDVSYSVERMASDMTLSRTQLFRKLKHLTGLSPQQYLQDVRLQHALSLLEMRQVNSVKGACYAVGFIKVKHFSQIFHERFGKLPSAYL